jgi:hypothetical protein
MAKAVRDPSCRNYRVPNWPVIRDFYPVAVFIKVGEAGSVRVYILRRPGRLDAPVAFITPLIEVVGCRHGNRFNLLRILAYQSGRFSSSEGL